MPDKLLLNYHDALIYESDLSILDSPTAWLNDACINFQFTRLQHRQQGDGTSDGRETDLFLDPSVISYLMHQCDEDDEDFLDEMSNLHHAWSLSAESKRIFIPINDQFNQSRTAFSRPGGGSHWSLLLWTLPDCNFYHFDSSSGYNSSAALTVSRKLLKVLRLKAIPGQPFETNVKTCKTPKQQNGYDCGVYLLGFAETLTSFHGESQKYGDVICKELSRDDFTKMLRKRISNDIRGIIQSEITPSC